MLERNKRGRIADRIMEHLMVNSPALADFKGDWLLERRIEDRLTGAIGTLEGRVRFSPDAEGLVYEEEGKLFLGSQAPLEATRRYLWRQGAGRIAVLFDDGRPFHEILPGQLMPSDLHHCAPDMYHVTYDFSSWPDWGVTWRVRGPRKDYRSVSRLTRA